MAAKYAKFESYLDGAMKAVLTGELRNRRKASSYLKEKIKQKALDMKDTGNLAKGVYKLDAATRSYVGSSAPHSYLVEFGTVERMHKSGKSVGVSPPRPFVYSAFAEEEGAIAAIMSEPWDKT